MTPTKERIVAMKHGIETKKTERNKRMRDKHTAFSFSPMKKGYLNHTKIILYIANLGIEKEHVGIKQSKNIGFQPET